MLKKLTPNLIVEDVEKSIEFYRDILGCFELITTDPKQGKIDWALMRCEDVEIMFQSRKSIEAKIPDLGTVQYAGNVILYIETDSIGSFFDWVKKRVDIVQPLQETPYRMKEFLIRDCNGFIITFAQFEQ